MNIYSQIKKAVNNIAYKDCRKNGIANKKTEAEKQSIIDNTIIAFDKSTFNLANYQLATLRQGTKKRLVVKYNDPFCPENILCQCVKQILDKNFKVKYPNRNAIARDLFACIGTLYKMSHFTIVKFDFKDYFNSVSSTYVFNQYLKDRLHNREDFDLIEKYVKATKFSYAGLAASNTISEIIAQYFDELVEQEFSQYGIIFFERYVDDCILLLNQDHSVTEIKDKLDLIVKNIYHKDQLNQYDKCKTKLSPNKFKCFSKKDIFASTSTCCIDFLGYEFYFTKSSNKIALKYGITEDKRNKYSKRVRKFIEAYQSASSRDYQNSELLRQRITAFISRTVYNDYYYSSIVWKAKGFIVNYGELRFLLDTNLIEPHTKIFLDNIIVNSFNQASIPIPYYIKGGGYSLTESMKKNQSIVLVEKIGYSYSALKTTCQNASIPVTNNEKNKSYNDLVKSYLIAMKVGY